MRSRHIERNQRKAQLLGPDGQPITSSIGEGIPFVQWLPNGKSTGRSIDRGPRVYVMAARFLASGGRYSYILRMDGYAELVAGIPVRNGEKGEMVVVAEEVVPDGPLVLPAIDRLIEASVANLDKIPIGETLQ